MENFFQCKYKAQAYVTATSHHIDEKWDMESHVLTTEKIETDMAEKVKRHKLPAVRCTPSGK
jgi:hypothetical protein